MKAKPWERARLARKASNVESVESPKVLTPQASARAARAPRLLDFLRVNLLCRNPGFQKQVYCAQS